ncbi:MAG: iron-containing alcohol dehydrogenase [Clostridiales bacterium]|nr:iron-containing alcohol dehydrogenase [Clostridiales bacterium]
MKWIYKQPVEIFFGGCEINRIYDLVKGCSSPLLVCSMCFVRNGLAEEIRGKIGNLSIFSDVSPNPDIKEVNLCSKLLREKGCDVIIALGGGSVIDLAKAASLGVPDISEYWGTGKAVPKEHIPLIAVPTTAGTGSEVTSVSVLTDRRTNKKAPLSAESLYPAAAVVDPKLLYTLPSRVTASSGIDVLCHAVEGFWSKNHQPVCDTLAFRAIKLILKYLPIAYNEPDNREAREKTAEASLLAGLAFNLPKTTAPHACSFPLTSICGIPHGEACGLTLDYFAVINGKDRHTQELTEALGYKNTYEFAEDIDRLKALLGLRRGLKDFNLTDRDIEELVRHSTHPNLKNNPVEITEEILYDMYNKLRRI